MDKETPSLEGQRDSDRLYDMKEDRLLHREGKTGFPEEQITSPAGRDQRTGAAREEWDQVGWTVRNPRRSQHLPGTKVKGHTATRLNLTPVQVWTLNPRDGQSYDFILLYFSSSYTLQIKIFSN